MKPIANNLDIPIEKLKGVSVKIAKPLKKLGIDTVRDLLWHIPTRYNDFSQVTTISGLRPNTTATIRARVSTLEEDRPPSNDIERITNLIAHGEVERACGVKVN